MPKITVTISGVNNKLTDTLSESIVNEKGYKYTYMKQLLSRLRVIISEVSDKPEDEQIKTIGNTLIVERNIANFAAEQYAKLGNDNLFDSFTEIVEDIEELFK